jgi:hypothetical protein
VLHHKILQVLEVPGAAAGGGAGSRLARTTGSQGVPVDAGDENLPLYFSDGRPDGHGRLQHGVNEMATSGQKQGGPGDVRDRDILNQSTHCGASGRDNSRPAV